MNTRKLLSIALVLVVGLLLVSAVLAQQGNGYDLTWWTVDGGGHIGVGAGSSSPYALGGTTGQPDAGLLTGGDYTLGGGFWSGGVSAAAIKVYLPLVLRQ